MSNIKNNAMVVRVYKNKNYTTMANYHLQEKTLSLKAKGLMSLFLSLPDNWEYSISGLVKLSKDSETSLKTAMEELKNAGYLQIEKIMPCKTKSGRIEYFYHIYEKTRG